ncbi:NUDIX domain-containing protein [Streptomyces sp. NPDC049577]|uniref:NUDIX domain-containing protein n=1 Tax=Streptomyces sp. NPDC049577 TaxID=3155153 RepID=UPI0034275FFC
MESARRGRREHGETLAEAAVRETNEETSVIVETGPVVHVSERLGPLPEQDGQNANR